MSYGTGRLERCTDNRPPFRTSEYIDGNRPHYSHTSNGVKLSAPPDLSTDGQFASLQIVGDAGFSFGNGPWKQNILGFGFGVIYSSPLDTEIGSHVEPVTGEPWVIEFSIHPLTPWRVKEENDFRFLESRNWEGGRMISFDSGIPTPENTTVFSSSLFYGEYDFQEGDNPATQLKTVRFNNSPGLPSDAGNSFYTRTFDHQSNPDKSCAVYYDDAGTLRARVMYGLNHPRMDEQWTLQTVIANNGNYDTENGWIKTGEAKPEVPYNEISAVDTGVIGTGTNLRLIQSVSEGTWQTASIQDYYSNAISGDSRGLMMRRADIIKQFGSAERLLLGDGPTPELSAWPVTQLPVFKHSVSNVIIFPWYRGLVDSFSGKYLHYYDDAGVYVGSCATGVE